MISGWQNRGVRSIDFCELFGPVHPGDFCIDTPRWFRGQSRAERAESQSSYSAGSKWDRIAQPELAEAEVRAIPRIPAFFREGMGEPKPRFRYRLTQRLPSDQKTSRLASLVIASRGITPPYNAR
jgi:hypothetical protein